MAQSKKSTRKLKGRPANYGKTYDEIIFPNLAKIAVWLSEGATIKTVAEKLGIHRATLYTYIKRGKTEERFAPLSSIFEQATDMADKEVETALFDSCFDRTITITKHYKVKHATYDGNTGRKISEHEELVPMEDTVSVPGNTFAQQFWLANRSPDRWKYKPKEDDKDSAENVTGVVLIPPVQEEVKSDGD